MFSSNSVNKHLLKTNYVPIPNLTNLLKSMKIPHCAMIALNKSSWNRLVSLREISVAGQRAVEAVFFFLTLIFPATFYLATLIYDNVEKAKGAFLYVTYS